MKTRMINIRVSEEDLKKIKRSAEKISGGSVSKLIRTMAKYLQIDAQGKYKGEIPITISE